jgi:hypothetical protein
MSAEHFIYIGAVLLGIGLAVLWFGRSGIKKPGRDWRGKRHYYTNGEIWMQKIKKNLKGGK